MTLASYGVDVDPGRLNKFLTDVAGGYTPQGWIYWEKAAEFDTGFTSRLLPHYEDLPTHFLIDRNLLDKNPVIARLRYPNGTTHFVVVCGKEGFDYLIRDPGRRRRERSLSFEAVRERNRGDSFYRNHDPHGREFQNRLRGGRRFAKNSSVPLLISGFLKRAHECSEALRVQPAKELAILPKDRTNDEAIRPGHVS